MFKNSILKIIGALVLFTVSITVNAASVDFDVYAKANSTSGSGAGLNTGLIYSVGDTITGSVDMLMIYGTQEAYLVGQMLMD